MKIALANNLYYPYNRGGAESLIKEMTSRLKSEGHEVFLITTKLKKDNPPENQNLKIYYINSLYRDLAKISVYQKVVWHFGNIFSFRKTITIKKILKSEKPDLIITHNLMGLGYLLPLAIKKLKIRHFHYLHDIQLLYPTGLMILGAEHIIDGFSAKIYQIFTRAFFASVTKVISPSHWLLGQHRQRGFFRNCETEIKLADKIPKIEAIGNPTNGPKKNLNFLFVGQIEEHKGIIFLIKSFILSLDTKSDLKLNIIGDGELLAEAKNLASQCPAIKFFGRLDNTQVQELMKRNDCLIVPSLCYENAPMTILEAHEAKLNVLAANIGGIPEMLSAQDRQFIPGNILDLKDKILNR